MNVHYLGVQEYNATWLKMKEFTTERTSDTEDELWILEHPPVYTQGQAGKPEHILNTSLIPIVQSDRGGQVTYHGPGQLIVYVLLDLIKLNIGVRTLVCKLEKTLISVLRRFDIPAETHCGAPGVYVKDEKIASIGLRVKSGRTYHGIALNVKMDLTPFNDINPCGFAKMKMTQISFFHPSVTIKEVCQFFIQDFRDQFK